MCICKLHLYRVHKGLSLPHSSCTPLPLIENNWEVINKIFANFSLRSFLYPPPSAISILKLRHDLQDSSGFTAVFVFISLSFFFYFLVASKFSFGYLAVVALTLRQGKPYPRCSFFSRSFFCSFFCSSSCSFSCCCCWCCFCYCREFSRLSCAILCTFVSHYFLPRRGTVQLATCSRPPPAAMALANLACAARAH